MMGWIKDISGAVYDQSVEVIARYPTGTFWFVVGLAGFALVGWVL